MENYKEEFGVEYKGRPDSVGYATYFVGVLAGAGLIVYGFQLFTYIEYGV